jgi:hypothetical protein
MHKTKNHLLFTLQQLKYFENEIKEAGGVDELMLRKEALKLVKDMTMIATYKDIEGYKEKYLTGVYQSLRTHYYTEVPYVFWSKLYDALQKI